jgi:glucose-6-phosphate 1-dehydrogenase
MIEYGVVLLLTLTIVGIPLALHRFIRWSLFVQACMVDERTGRESLAKSSQLVRVPLTLTANLQPPELPACGRILLDVLRGDATLSIRADEAEEAWRILTPIMDAGSREIVPLQEYNAGSDDPSAAA